MFKVFEHGLGKTVWFSRSPVVTDAEMQRFVQVTSVAEIVGPLLLFKSWFFIVNVEILCELIDKVVDKHRLRDIGAASTTPAFIDLLIERAPPRSTWPSKTPPDS